jgi:hypothetical protein
LVAVEKVHKPYYSKSSIFWDIAPCSPLKVNHVLGEHVTSIFRAEELDKRARNQRE